MKGHTLEPVLASTGNHNGPHGDLSSVRCSEAREALSARYDAEPVGVEEAALRAHVAGCAGCAGFEHSLAPLAGVARRSAAPLPGRPPAALTGLTARGRVVARTALRLGVAALAMVELVSAVIEMLDSHDHEAHESSSFTVALCVALVYAALRPRVAGTYVPVLASASALLLVTSAEDLDHGAIGLLHELPHLGLVLGTVLLWLLAAEDSGRPMPRLRPRRALSRREGRSRPRLHAVTRAGVATVVTAVLTGSLVLLAGPASAHAVLEASDPRPDSVLATRPASVTLTFDEPVTIVPGSVRVYQPDGERIDRGDVTHPGGHGTRVAVTLRATDSVAQGSYLVSWRVVSADSHPVAGAFTFAVGKAGAAPPTPHDTGSRGISIALAVARWLGYAGSALLVGVLLIVAWCWAAGWALRRVRRIALAGAVLLVVGAVADLLFKGPYDAALGLGAITDGTLLREVLTSTYGRATIVRLVLAGAVGVLLAWRAPRRPLSAVLVSAYALAVGLTFAFAGHAAAGSGRTLALVNDTIHVLAASTWLGGLVLVLLALDSGGAGGVGGPGGVDGAGQPSLRPGEAAAVVRRFSQVALGAVLLLVATGIWQAARHVGSWGALRHTTYGHELLSKLVAVALVLVLAAGSRALVRRAGSGPARIRAVVLGETLGLAVVLGITSALVATEPADVAYHPSVSARLVLVGDTIEVSAVPDGERRMELHLYAFDGSGAPTEPKEITAAVSLPGKQLGPLPVTLTSAGAGHRAATIAVPVAGQWRLAVTVRTTAIDQATGEVILPIH